MLVNRVWAGLTAFGRFWYSFIIGDDWASAAGVLVMLGAAYGLIKAHVPAWWAGPVVITLTLMITLSRSARRQAQARSAKAGAAATPPPGERPGAGAQHKRRRRPGEDLSGH